MVTKEDIIEFEKEVADSYESGKIRAPVHLRSGNEEVLVNFFKDERISKDDWVFSTWASHAHALCKGVNRDVLMRDILDGKSITLHYPADKFFSSAIVGGICPIAVGTAWSIKQREESSRVYCFVGDMAFRTGTFHESFMYALGHDLPITFVVEDNEVSVATPTQEVWMQSTEAYWGYLNLLSNKKSNIEILYYKYKNGYIHSGTGVFVEF